MGLFNKKSDEQKKAERKIDDLCGGFLGNDVFKNKLEKNNMDSTTSNLYYKKVLKNEIKNNTLNYDDIESRLDELMKLDVDTLESKIRIRHKQDTSLFKTQQDINDFLGTEYAEKYNKSIEKAKAKNLEKERLKAEKEEEKRIKNLEKERLKAEKEEEKRIKNLEKEKDKIKKLEDKFNISLTGKKWFKCSIEEIKYSTFSNQRQRNVDHAYVIISEDNFEIIKESFWLKSNMGTRKLYFINITSIDYDARGKLHASSSVIINTKSAEHIQLKFVSKDNFDLMNNAFESFIEKTHKPQTEQIQQNVTTTSNADELLKYAELYEKGLLTKEEFDLKKSELLSNKQNSIEQSSMDEITSIKESKGKFCSNCGTQIKEDDVFCSKCGNKLE